MITRIIGNKTYAQEVYGENITVFDHDDKSVELFSCTDLIFKFTTNAENKTFEVHNLIEIHENPKNISVEFANTSWYLCNLYQRYESHYMKGLVKALNPSHAEKIFRKYHDNYSFDFSCEFFDLNEFNSKDFISL